MKKIVFLSIFIAARAVAEVGFAAPVFWDKKHVGFTQKGQIVLDASKKKFFAAEEISPDVSLTAFNSTVPMITCWQGFKPDTPDAEGRWRRVGDTMEVMIRFNVIGTSFAAKPGFSLPEGYKAKSADGELLGFGVLTSERGTANIDVRYDEKKNRLVPYVRTETGQSRSFAEIEFSSADYLNFKAQMTIQGWSDSAPKIDDEC